MKFKKIASALLASVVAAASAMTVSASAETANATYCFDNNSHISDWNPYGSVEQTGTAIRYTNYESLNGEGCIVISENVKGEVDDLFGGYYIEASSLGLTDFRGCTIKMSVKLCEGAENYCDNLALYTDGLIWISQNAENLSSKEWTTVSMLVPSGAENSKVGFTIPTFSTYSGDIAYIDDFTVINADGTVIANVGDYQEKSFNAEDAVPTWQNILLTILLVVLILAIIGGIGLIVSSILRKFT